MSNYKLVPVEPAPKMLQVWKSMYGYSRYGKYKAMLAEAPVINIVATKNEQGQIVSVTLQDADHRILEVIAEADVQGEPVVRQPVDELRFEYRHPKTGEAYTVSLSREEVVEMMDQELFEKLTACFCECEPIGETYVVDCRCDEYADQFELVTTPQPAEQPTISAYACTVPDDCETLHWRGQILSMNELVSVTQPAVDEEIHVHIEGRDVLTLPLASSGMSAPRFVVHVPVQQPAPDVAELQAELERERKRRFDGNEQASREHREDMKSLVEALEELVDLMEDVRQGEYIPDSFTTQPARIALAAHRKGGES